MQKQLAIEKQQPTLCSGCGRSPHGWIDLRNDRHFIECSRCGIATGQFATQAEAVAAWNRQARVVRLLNRSECPHEC